MERSRSRLLRIGLLLTGVLGLAVGTFLVLDLLGLHGTDRFLGYMLVTTIVAGGLIFYTTSVVVSHQREGAGESARRVEDPDRGIEE